MFNDKFTFFYYSDYFSDISVLQEIKRMKESFSGRSIYGWDMPLSITYDKFSGNSELRGRAGMCRLSVILNGTAVRAVGGELYNYGRGDVFSAGKGEPCRFSQAQELEVFSVFFRYESIAPLEAESDTDGFEKLFGGISDPEADSRFTLNAEDYISVYEIICTMRREYDSSAYGREAALSAYFMLLMVDLVRICGQRSYESRRDISNVSYTAAFIEKHYTEKLLLKDLAEMSHYSVRQFLRIFQSIYGTTPQQYILELRLKHACTLLRETDLSIEDTALRSGFGDGNYFSRTFKKHMGATPKEYRSRR